MITRDSDGSATSYSAAGNCCSGVGLAMELSSIMLKALYHPWGKEESIFMGRKRSSAAVASPEPESSGGKRIVSSRGSRPDKRVKFELPEAQSISTEELVTPTTTTIEDLIVHPRRSRRRTRMADQSDDQLRQSGLSEDWSGIEDREERRRIQNRISQRKFSKSPLTAHSTHLEGQKRLQLRLSWGLPLFIDTGIALNLASQAYACLMVHIHGQAS